MHSSKQAYMSDLEVKDLWFLMVFMQSAIFVAEKVKDLDKELGQYYWEKRRETYNFMLQQMVQHNGPYKHTI